MCAQIAGLSSKVKVVKGARKPLQRQYDGETGIAIHGDNGIGNVELPFKVDMTPVESHSHVSAAAYLVEACAAAPGEITLVTLGPLTNIAVLYRANKQLGLCVLCLLLYVCGEVRLLSSGADCCVPVLLCCALLPPGCLFVEPDLSENSQEVGHDGWCHPRCW